MRREVRALGVVIAVVLPVLLAVVLVPSIASAASRTWTSDTDFNAAGSAFLGTRVVGVGAAASVELTRDSLDWKDQAPAGPPGLREGPGLAFSSFDNVSVLFGGWTGAAYSDETWEYDYPTNAWAHITPALSPPGRELPAMAYDPVERVAVLFGGYDSGGLRSDTWEYDVVANAWSETTPASSPPTMASNALAYDASAARHVLVGWSTSPDEFATWAYNAAANTWAFRTASGPSNRVDHALAYHPGRGRTVLFGGLGGVPPNLTPFADTWEYNYGANAWSQVMPTSAPTARYGHGMTYTPDLSSVLLYGGTTGTTLSSNTWRYYSNATGVGTWTNLNTITSPPGRYYHGFAFDAKNTVGILYGGRNLVNELGDTWALGSSYRSSGEHTSAVFDSVAANTDWQTIFWNRTAQPAGTTLRFQLAASNNAAGPFFYGGPDGTAATYYTTATGQSTWSGLDNLRYLKYRAVLQTTDPQATPVLEDVTIVYNIPPAPPYVVSTDPADLASGVPVTKVVRVVFSEPMIQGSLSWTFVQGPAVTFLPVWSGGDTILDLTHPAEPFAENTVYRLRVDATDVDGNALVANPNNPSVVNPWLFATEAVPPTIVQTSPSAGQMNVALNAPVVVDFSEGMDTTSVTWTIAPAIALTPGWSLGDTRLTLTHGTDFQSCTDYTVQVFGDDKAGVPLEPSTVPNPWTFRTVCLNPYITSALPGAWNTGVALTAPVIVDFSEPMDTAVTTMTLVPDVNPKTFTFSNGGRRLTLTHPSGPFTGCRVYEVTVTGRNVAGNQLIPSPGGSPPNPWRFMTVCANPFLLFTNPVDGQTDVAVDQNIILGFSEAMNTGSVQYTITPPVMVFSEDWSDPTMLVIVHLPFSQCERYRVEVTAGQDTSGLPLVPGLAPSPFTFDTVCVAPYVRSTDPADQATLVPLTKSVVVEFSEPMDPTSLFVGSSPTIALTPIWSNNNQTLTLVHAADFVDCTEYMFAVNGIGADGNPLILPSPSIGAPDPWTFTTRCSGFYIVRTDPANLQQDVPLDQNIEVEFSQPVDVPTFQITLIPGVALIPVWSGGNTVVTLSHMVPFPECTDHTATVAAKNQTGNDLQTVLGSAPNPWAFTTFCIPPQILSTDPPDGATNVLLAAPIIVEFSEPMTRASVSWTILPSITLTPSSWTNGDRTLTLTHAVSFQANTRYTVTISGTDLDGMPLAPGPVPNPWSFTTGAGLPPPGSLQVIRQLPNDIVLTWRAVAGATRYAVYSVVNRFTAWPWPQLAEVTTTSYLAVGHLADGLAHYYIVRAKDAGSGQSQNSTMGAKVPLSFAFSSLRSNVYWMSLPYRSIYKKASDISNELTSARIDVVGKWNPTTQSSILWFFFRGAWRGVDFTLDPGDGFYIGIRSSFAWVINGTDGSVPRMFTAYPPPNANIHWISLPYTSSYQNAAGIVLDIEGSLGGGANTKIVEVAKWDALTQQLVRFFWTSTGWTGTNFTIGPGEGLYFRVLSSFSWQPRLLTPEMP